MSKHDIAQYLVNLNALMDAQTSIGNLPSTVLKDEYNRVWDQLKEEITNDEARKSNEQHVRTEERTEREVSRPGRGE